jgi:glycosyltransferase involved in cell wall biosynthesis
MSSNHAAPPDIVLLIAPYCFIPNSHWYSPGRHQKLIQVERLLESLSFSIFRINTSPDPNSKDHVRTLQLTCTRFPLLRLIQSALTIVFFLAGRPFRSHTPILWIYNTRFSEALIALLVIAFYPSIPLYLQIEDLPGARVQNSGLRGFLDKICLYILVRRSERVFAVSTVVFQAMQVMAKTKVPTTSPLPPLLSSAFLTAVNSRTQPFSRSTNTILYAGGYGVEKGVEDLISAFLQVSPVDSVLQLIGPVPLNLVSSYSSDHRIQVVGHVSNLQLYSRYANADIVVCPHRVSKYSSSIFPFKLIEYVASGALPLITYMPGSEILGLPAACFFNSVDELASKLSTAHSLWIQHQHRLIASSEIIRDRFSFQRVRSSLALDLCRLPLAEDF